jgi:hypothetical protein
MMAECRPVEAPEFALPSADDHAAGRASEAEELTISPAASRNASSILSSVVVISACSLARILPPKAKVRSWYDPYRSTFGSFLTDTKTR